MSDRKVTVFISRNGGRTWGAGRECSLGELGEYLNRVRLRRLGRSHQFCVKIRVTSPISMNHLGAVADMEVGA